VDISTEGFRKHFAELSDEALLEQRRADLVPAAQSCLDEELAARGLSRPKPTAEAEPETDDHEEAIVIATFAGVPEAEIAQALLEAEGIVATLVHQDTTGLETPATKGLGLAVEPLEAARARLVLEQGLEQAMAISDEELAAQAEAAGSELEESEQQEEHEESPG
jgi:hypothetical protein